MPIEAHLLLGLTLSLALAWASTPVAIRVAQRFEFYDKPAGYKGHARPTPYLGGAAVMAAFVTVLLVLTGDWSRTLPLVGGVIVLWTVGTVDDRRQISPLGRVVVEVALATMLWSLGLGWELGLGSAVDLALSVCWIVGVVNAFNLFDNMDGASGSMAAVVSAALAVVGALEGDVWLTVSAAALCGACAGFLPYNLCSPARIFLGDGGSMPIGFAVGALVMVGASATAPEWQSLAMGLMLIGIPALDTALVIVSRRRRGVSVLTAGRDHLTHRARSRLVTARAVALTLGAMQALVSVLAIVAVRGGSATLVVAVIVYLIGLATVIALLDTRLAPTPEGRAAIADGGQRLPGAGPVLVLLPLGVALALSPFASAYYDSRIWVPAGLGMVGIAAAVFVARPPRLTRPALGALASLGALGCWALLSTTWADSVEQAVVDGNRLLVYTILLGTLLVLVRTTAHALWLVGAVGIATVGVAAVVLVQMLGSAAPDLFVGGRLDAPLGYINGQAAFFMLAFWICMAAAEQRHSSLLAGAGALCAVLVLSMVVLSQSRGVAVAGLAATMVLLALVPGRLRRAWLLVLVGSTVGIASTELLDVYRSAVDGRVGAPEGNEAAAATLLSAALAGVVWGIGSAFVRRPERHELARAWSARVLCVLVLGIAGLLLASQAGIRQTISTQYHAFVNVSIEPQGSAVPSPSATTSRLVSGAGTRYDYWRIAWATFRAEPIRGVGAGGYDRPYFAQRATVEDVRQPHSLQMQTLSELGSVGGALVLVLLIALGVGVRRLAASARASHEGRFLAVATGGILVSWVVHTSVDWLHLLPGVTGIALVAAAVALRPAPGDPAAAPRRREADPTAVARRVAANAAVGILLILSTFSLTRQGLAEFYRERAQSALARDPGRALIEVNRSLRLDAEGLSSYYIKAAALARFGKASAAELTLLEAARREPADFVTWGLLGDLSVRRARIDEARRYYGRALELNPRDQGLQRLTADPIAASATP